MISKYLKKIGERSKVAALNIVKVDIKKRNKVLETYNKELLKNIISTATPINNLFIELITC